MSAENVQTGGAKADFRIRRLLWDGVLPEALGLCFVAIIFGGFAAAYWTADYTWKAQAVTAARSDAQAQADLLAQSFGTLVSSDPQAAEEWLGKLAQTAHLRRVRWTRPDGGAGFDWPPLAGSAATDDVDAVLVLATVRSPANEALGTLQIETGTAGPTGYQASLLWNWGIAAGVTLLVFAALYHRLRRHLRPMAAIERNLQSYAGGVEHELTTLALSDSLGGVAQGWNRLIGQITDLQEQLHNARQAGPVQNVLARFEGTVFRRVVERLPFGILCVGEDECFSYANATAAALLRSTADELMGQAVGAAIPDPAVRQALLGTRARGGAGMTVDHSLQEGDQETTLRFRILPLSDQPRSGPVLITVEDIGQLRESKRAQDNFLYHVTHELRTPLTNIHAYAETLTKPGFDDEQTRKECYNVIISETRRLSRLVEDILGISQLEVGSARLDASEVDLQRLVRQMVQDNLGGADEKHIDLTLELPPKLPKIQGDKQRLSVLLNNLIGNAIKYTPAEGKVHVKVEVTERGLQIAVRDNGIGIKPEDQAHVFDKFYRAADESVQAVTGTGLGLALAREVARLHGGEIHLESEYGVGSTFTIELPLPSSERVEGAVR